MKEVELRLYMWETQSSSRYHIVRQHPPLRDRGSLWVSVGEAYDEAADRVGGFSRFQVHFRVAGSQAMTLYAGCDMHPLNVRSTEYYFRVLAHADEGASVQPSVKTTEIVFGARQGEKGE